MDDGKNLAKVLWYYGLIQSISDTKIICPFHDDVNPSMTVDYKNGLCFCFGCQTMAGPVSIVRKIESRYNGLNDLQAYLKYLRILKSDKCSNIQLPVNVRTKHRGADRELYDISYDYYHGLPRIDWRSTTDIDAVEIAEYMRGRGFFPETLNMAGARITYNKNYMLIFPMLDNGKFRGWVCRTNRPEIEKKRKYLYNRGFSRYNTLVGEYGSKNYVFVVEGYLDRLKFLQWGVTNVVAILGWKITDHQIVKLKSAGITTVISALDNDKCGRRGTEYLKKFFNVVRFRYLKNVKDVGETTRETFNKMCGKTMEILEGANNGNIS